MRHEEAFERLVDVVNPQGQGTDGIDAAVLAHAARCPTCAARLATLTRLDRSILGAAHDHGAVEEPSRELERRVLAIPSTRSRVPRRRSRRVRVAVAVAAVALAGAIPLWLGSRGAGGDRAVARTMPLHARNGSLSGSVAVGPLRGATRAVRLTADGFATGRADYSVWLTGPDGDILIRSFSANAEGACDIRADAPDGRWSGIAITMNGRPPVSSAILASASLPLD